MHGNATYASCLDCHKVYSLEGLKQVWERSEQALAPRCDACQGIIKVATISFGQPMPAKATKAAFDSLKDCDLFICLGTSLSVYPIADMVQQAASKGIPLVLFNRDETSSDHLATLHSQAELGSIFKGVLEELKATS